MFELTKASDFSTSPREFLAIGFQNNGNDNNHASLLIRVDGSYYEAHFNQNRIQFFRLSQADFGFFPSQYIKKEVESVRESDLPAILSLCRIVSERQDNDNPQFGLFYSGEYYKPDASLSEDLPIGNRMTCVGFCLRILGAFFETGYISINDWPNYFEPDDDNFIRYCRRNNLNPEEAVKYCKRILPEELLTSGYLNNHPIPKIQIDNLLPTVLDQIETVV